MLKIAFGLLSLQLIFPQQATAYPEMVRHFYVNCNACHVNPNGGGLLTEYGRGISAEVLSTWHYENEALFAHGLLKQEKLPSFFNIGGDLRALQVHRETRRVREGRYVLMQAQLEAAITAGPLSAVAAFGEPDSQNHIRGEFTHFYLLGNLGDTLQLKAGRFLPAFGIHEPHHIFSTRQALGFGFNSERDGLEAHYSGEQWHAAAGLSRSRKDSAVLQREDAVNLQLEKFFSDKYRVGVSFWKGSFAQEKRWLLSLHGIFGFTEHTYFVTETAWRNLKSDLSGSATETGIFHFGRFGYEALQGLHLTAIEDLSKSNVTQPNTLTVLLGGGPVWYPRPHFELELVFSQRKILRQSSDFEDYAYFMAHYYL